MPVEPKGRFVPRNMKVGMGKKIGVSCSVKYGALRKLFLCLMFVSVPSYSEVDLGGSIGATQRYFFNTPEHPGQLDNDSMEIVAEPELFWWGEKDFKITFKGFIRARSDDPERNHGDIRELYFSYSVADLDITIGVNEVFWGVTESWGVVDVINQVDLVESIYQDQKLGQGMVNLTLLKDWGSFGVYWLPGFRERNYSGVEGRLRSSIPVDNDEAIYSDSGKNEHQDYAIRYSHYIGDMDIGIHWFDGINREPMLTLDESETYLIPVYSDMRQIGLDLQYTIEAWLLKYEAVRNFNDSDDYVALVAGFEYTLFQLLSTDADLGLLVEYLFDDRSENASAFDDDIFMGARLAMNNSQDASLLAGAIWDVNTSEIVFNVEYLNRIGKQITIDIEATIFGEADNSFADIKKDDNVEATFAWHF